MHIKVVCRASSDEPAWFKSQERSSVTTECVGRPHQPTQHDHYSDWPSLSLPCALLTIPPAPLSAPLQLFDGNRSGKIEYYEFVKTLFPKSMR